MNKNQLIQSYKEKRKAINAKLNEFKELKEADYFNELLFCILTPQSNAKKCWEAVEQLVKIEKIEQKNKKKIENILKSKTRFHNNKSKYILEAKNSWDHILEKLNNNNIIELRNYLAENINGIGYKEASHFLRNIGKSNNEIAILDRHILKNLKDLRLIENTRIKGKKDYLEIEKKFINFSKSINISIDHLDLLFWSQENGEIFK